MLESTEPSEGGSVVIDRVHEHLQDTLDAYNSRITPLTKIPKKLQEYPNPQEEKVRLNLTLADDQRYVNHAIKATTYYKTGKSIDETEFGNHP